MGVSRSRKLTRFAVVVVALAGLGASCDQNGSSNGGTTPSDVIPTPAPCNASRSGATSDRRALEEQRSSLPTERIVGGDEAVRGIWPWAAAITFARNGTLRQYCGGSLIAPNWVLTAAHCEVDASDTVILGRHNLTESDGEELAISFVLTHNGYNDTTNDNDIALIRLASPSSQSPVALTDGADSNSQPGDDATIIGWGRLAEGGSASDTLQHVTVPIVTNGRCDDVYSNLTGNMLCAGRELGGQDSCQGDSGGPLMVRASSAAPWQQSGVVSFGIGCARPQIFGVYTRVSQYVDWIGACQNNPPN